MVFSSILLLVACHGSRKTTPSPTPTPTPIHSSQAKSAYRLVISSRPIDDFSIFDNAFSGAEQPTAVPPLPIQPADSTKSLETVASTQVSGPVASHAQPPANPVVPLETVQTFVTAEQLAAYPPDTAVFKNEDLIETKDRMLSDYAYAPIDPALTAQYNAPWKGEQLKFGVYYGFIKAGNAYIKNKGVAVVNNRPAYLIQTTAFSASVIDAVFKVRDINLSWIDAENFASLGYTQSIREGKYKRDEWVHFDYENLKFYGKVQRKAEPFPIGGEIAGYVSDILSSLYFIRGQKLEVGQDIIIDVVNREKAYPFVVKVLKKEKVKTAAGTFNTILVEPMLRGEGIFIQKGKSLQVWLTDDEFRMPVKMKTEVFIGSVSAELLEYKRY